MRNSKHCLLQWNWSIIKEKDLNMTLVITGASSGIGGRIYKDMCEVVSDKVICISRNKPEQLADKDEWLKCDLSKSEE